MSSHPVLRGVDGSSISLEPGRWRGHPTPEEERILAEVVGPALDVGCGPGRHVLALARMGVPALGIDISPLAVTVARDRGAAVLQRCVFRPLPLAEGWQTVLLLDGNIGIGGSPTTLLRRIGHLLAPGGRALVEVDPPGTPTGRMQVRVEHGSVCGPWFAWARLAASRVPHVAEAAGFEVAGAWASRGRWFARLDRRPDSSDHASHWYSHDQECVMCSVCGRGEPGADVWAVALAEGA